MHLGKLEFLFFLFNKIKIKFLEKLNNFYRTLLEYKITHLLLILERFLRQFLLKLKKKCFDVIINTLKIVF